MNGKPSAPSSAKGQEVDLSIPNLSATALRDCHRRHIEEELGSKRAVQLAYAYGARSITLKQALDARFRKNRVLLCAHTCGGLRSAVFG